MPHVRIVHTTDYRYVRPVRFTEHRLMLRPRDSHDLRVRDATIAFTPSTTQMRWAHDVFGNSICYIDPGEAKSDRLRIVSKLDLDHFPLREDLPLDPVAETFPFSYDAAEFPDIARLLERHYLDPERRVDVWARSFLNPRGPTRTMDLLEAITRAIKADFRYEARDAQGTNPPNQTLTTRRGACRDFALLMIEAARALGFAARFMSGYLYDEKLMDSDEAMVGGGATHAWVAVYLPGGGWVEFDPTNGLVAGRNLIRVSVARTPDQAIPVSGSFIGSVEDFVGLSVDVEVAVSAIEDA